MKVQTYLCFEGRCEEAIEFYKTSLAAELVMMMRYGQTPQDGEEGCGGFTPGAEKIAHAVVKIGDIELLMSDGMCSGQAEFRGVTLSISVDNDEQAKEKFTAIAEGGKILMDLRKTFFASSWGVCADQFGVNWMVLAPIPVPANA